MSTLLPLQSDNSSIQSTLLTLLNGALNSTTQMPFCGIEPAKDSIENKDI
jgi:hypothetical protein